MVIYNFFNRNFATKKPNYDLKEITLYLEPMTDKTILYNSGTILRRLRHRKNATQKELCDATGLNAASYSRIESGTINLRLTDIVILAKYYDVQPYLLVAMILDGNIAAVESEVI